MVPRAVAVALSIGALLMTALSARLPKPHAVALGLAGCLALVLTFFLGSSSAHAKVAAVSGARYAGGPRVLEDVVLTPAIANPLCVSAFILETDGERYFVRTATVSTAPSVMDVERCVFPPSSPSTPLTPLQGGSAAVRFQAEWSAPLAELRALSTRNCVAAALLRFARVPVFRRMDAGTWYGGDLRYDREPSLGFAELSIPERPETCPPNLPPWQPPRWRWLQVPR
jgi:hypothetical protein